MSTKPISYRATDTFYRYNLDDDKCNEAINIVYPQNCTKESLDEVFRLTKGHIVYVSCNPATLARDLKYLTEKGAKVESIQPFDMFCHTYHVENVAIIKV